MSIRLFGPRVLLKYEKPKETSNIMLPDITGQHDLHRFGRVKFVGDGDYRDPLTKQQRHDDPLVKEGELVMFQINDVMRWAQVYRYLEDNMLHVLQGELIGRINGESVNLDTFEILGNFVLVKPELRKTDCAIIRPDTIARTTESVTYTVVQLGSLVNLPIEVGQEIIINHGRVNCIYIMTKKSGINPPEYKQVEYGYVFKDFVHGMVEAAGA